MASIGLWLSVLLGFNGNSAITQPQPTMLFCTAVGAVELIIQDDQVRGRYQVLTPNKRIDGTISGRLINHRVVGTWQDPDGEGDIVIFFHDNFTGMSAVYNNAKRLSHWYPVWQGLTPEAHDSANQKRLEKGESRVLWRCKFEKL